MCGGAALRVTLGSYGGGAGASAFFGKCGEGGVWVRALWGNADERLGARSRAFWEPQIRRVGRARGGGTARPFRENAAKGGVRMDYMGISGGAHGEGLMGRALFWKNADKEGICFKRG